MPCGKLVFDVPKPTGGGGAPKPVAGPSSAARRRQAYYSDTLHHLSFKAQNLDTWGFRDCVVFLFGLYALGWCGFLALRELWEVLFVTPTRTVCYREALVGCLWTYAWQVGYGILGTWVRDVLPWGIVAALGIFFGEEAIAWWSARAKKGD